jgi:hypothetical protein
LGKIRGIKNDGKRGLNHSSKGAKIMAHDSIFTGMNVTGDLTKGDDVDIVGKGGCLPEGGKSKPLMILYLQRSLTVPWQSHTRSMVAKSELVGRSETVTRCADIPRGIEEEANEIDRGLREEEREMNRI